MKSFLKAIILASFALVLLAACGGNEASDGSNSGDKLQVVSSFTIITDMVREVGGDKVEVHNLVPTGTDPHEYEPLPEDIKKSTDADILFYNGMNLEGGEDGWFFKMVDSVGQDRSKAYSLTERVEPMYLRDEATREEEVNPHSFIDPVVGIYMVEDMRDAFIEVDPDNKEYYEERASNYLERLHEIEIEYEERLGAIPEENRILVTSECAFQYMLDRYNMGEECIWKVDTEENGSPEQIKSLISFIEENNVPILFLESNVDPRPMETVSKESGVPIYEKPIYSDEIGNPGDEVDTYIKYLQYNIDVISDGLSK
ncbi:metal ABC transporter solute-binding protein, Zn/Mn family [Pueribacillus sp. YX66]|uniref:metal ABC transporter solute-binding protein, Zn/Mn family n=1 Tax=Pueribacillus sp. YX66 TaxID=3229242 RepID=UPI00358D86D9